MAHSTFRLTIFFSILKKFYNIIFFFIVYLVKPFFSLHEYIRSWFLKRNGLKKLILAKYEFNFWIFQKKNTNFKSMLIIDFFPHLYRELLGGRPILRAKNGRMRHDVQKFIEPVRHQTTLQF